MNIIILEIKLELFYISIPVENCFMIKKRPESKKKKNSLNNNKNNKLGLNSNSDIILFKFTGPYMIQKANISSNGLSSKITAKSPTFTPTSKIRKQSK